MNTILRFKAYLEVKKITNGRAEKDCGLSNGLIGNAIKAGSALGSDKLEKILSVYPDLSAEWLLRGTGNMIIGDGVDQEQLLKSINLPVNSREIIDLWLKFMEVTKGLQDMYKQTLLNE